MLMSMVVGWLAAAVAPNTAPPLPVNAPAVTRAAPRSDFGYLTGKELYGRCTETSPSSGVYCFAYLAAIHDSMRAYERWLTIREFCPPPGTANADLRAAFLVQARAHPADLDGQAASVVVNALKQAYPCPAQ